MPNDAHLRFQASICNGYPCTVLQISDEYPLFQRAGIKKGLSVENPSAAVD